jgi:hypothetical protein
MWKITSMRIPLLLLPMSGSDTPIFGHIRLLWMRYYCLQYWRGGSHVEIPCGWNFVSNGTVPAELERAVYCSSARHNELGTYLGVCCPFLSSDFVHKTFQVLSSSRLQNQHAQACTGRGLHSTLLTRSGLI